MADPALYRLMTWLSPAYPVGAFSYSQGLEAAVSAGLVADAGSTQAWLEDLARSGSLWSDAVVFARAYDAASRGDGEELFDVTAFALAFQPTAELRFEAVEQGRAFLGVTRRAWSCEALDLVPEGDVPYPVAVATACAGHEVDRGAALGAYLHAAAANLVAAAIRLVPLGQTDGQRILAALEPVLTDAAAGAAVTSLDDLGTACLMAEIQSMRHETQPVRLFRT